jgi:hypothetical protein
MTTGPEDLISDLDALIEKPVSFRLHGRIHSILPITTETFMVYTNAFANLYELNKQEKISPKELILRYHDIISSVCKTVSVEDIENMTQPQIAALYQLIVDTVQGKTQAQIGEAEKKKLMGTQTLPLVELKT